MLWVYGHFKYFYPCSAGINFSRHNLTSKVDPHAVRVNPKGAEIFVNTPRDQIFFNLKSSSMTCLALSTSIKIPMLWVYGHYNFLIISVLGLTLDARF